MAKRNCVEEREREGYITAGERGDSVSTRLGGLALAVLVGVVTLTAGTALGQEKAGALRVKAVKFGRLWDGKGKVWRNAIVIVEGDRVKEVTTDGKRIPAGAEVVDLSKYYGIPGMIDVHTHMTIYTDETPGVPMLKQLASP